MSFLRINMLKRMWIGIEARLTQALGINEHNGMLPVLAMDCNHLPLASEESSSILDSIIDKGFLWGVPKTRVSLEKRHKRKNGHTKMEKFATAKKNIIPCLACGHYHEAHTICGNCYSKVKEETERMQSSLPEYQRLFNVPKEEVTFVYSNEKVNKEQSKGKFIVELDRPRPSWWPKNLMSKSNEN